MMPQVLPSVVGEGDLLWSPLTVAQPATGLARFRAWLLENHALAFEDYESLRRWSVTDLEAFWGAVWHFTDILSSTKFTRVLNDGTMPGVRWFEGSRVNYAEHLLRYERHAPGQVVFHHLSELRPLNTMCWRTLGRNVRCLATQMRAMGLEPGDRVVGILPNTPEAAVAMMATMAIGAVWSSAAPEFGVRTVIDRFMQIEPKLLFAADGYRFGGKDYPRQAEIRAVIDGLPTLENLIWLPYLDEDAPSPEGIRSVAWEIIMARPDVAAEVFEYTRVAHDHPLWILFSSGTTGLPKAIVHSHVGALLEHQKLMHLHFDFGPRSVMLFYTTTGWMMWNLLLAALLTGAAVVLYDGSPTTPSVDFLWRLAADTGATSFGASPTFVQMMERAKLEPGKSFDLSSLQQVVIAGAPSTPEMFAWFYRHVKRDLWVTSQSGGTEIVSGFVGAASGLAVHAGEIQTRMLGMDVHAWSDDGADLTDVVGELVVTKPCPSMPIYFWNDPGGSRYREAYFANYPGVWRHGDFIKINARGGCYIYGRSDSTLNRHGVRIGTAEIYRSVEAVEGVADSLIVCCELPGGHFFMPLFLRLQEGIELDAALQRRIATRLREECSPRHVPDRMYQVSGIPMTLTGKKMEVPVRKLLMGWALERACSRDAMANPETIDYFVRFAEESADYQWRS